VRDANGKFTAGHQEKLKHGYAQKGRIHPLWYVWVHMIERCQYPKRPGWENYGGRGITVCAQWQTFGGFLDDMGPKYQRGLTLERLDNDKGYSPDNCCWATRFQQSRNQRKTIRVSDGCLKDAAAKAGVKYHTVYARRKRGWPQSRWFEPEDARYK
jgi:hypothetical protein